MKVVFTSEVVKNTRRYDNDWLTVCAMLVIFLFHCARFFNFKDEKLKYSREAVLPFYILHQTVIVVIGFYIADWQMRVMLKYLILSILSFVVIVVVYDLLIRRVGTLRLLFGMKARKQVFIMS